MGFDLVPILITVQGENPPASRCASVGPLCKGGGEGGAERGIWITQQDKGSESYSDRLLVNAPE
jgi:hypothetical protein